MLRGSDATATVRIAITPIPRIDGAITGVADDAGVTATVIERHTVIATMASIGGRRLETDATEW